MAWEPGGENNSICLSALILWGTLEGREKGEHGSVKVKEWKREVLRLDLKKEEGYPFPYEKQKGLQ